MIRLAPIAVALCVLFFGASGCAQTATSKQTAFHWPWQKEQEKIPGVTPPRERIKELQSLAAKNGAGTSNPGLSAELAKQIQHEQDALVRQHIVRTIATCSDPTASAVLHAALGDPDEEVRIACCEAWGKKGGAEAVEELSTALQSDTSTDVRIAAAKALGKTKNAAAVKPLADVLVDSDPAMQRRAVESLKAVSKEDYGNDFEAWRQYAAGVPVQQKPVGIAERFRKLF